MPVDAPAIFRELDNLYFPYFAFSKASLLVLTAILEKKIEFGITKIIWSLSDTFRAYWSLI